MKTVTTNGVTTHYEVQGQGPPIVCIHGAILDHAAWDGVRDALADDYTVYTYDVRGHGHTGPTDVDPYTIDLFADDLAAFLDALDIEQPVLCGHSLGGCIAQVYSSRHPDRVAGLVLASTFAPEYVSLGDRLQRQFVIAAAVYPVRLIGYERVERGLVWLNETFGRSGSSGDYENVQALRRDAPPMSTAEFAKTIRAIRDFHHVTIDYTAIPVPTLVLYGEREPGFVERHATRFASLLPDAEVHAVPGAGHASNMDNPDFYAAQIRALLQRGQTERGRPTERREAG